MSDPLLPWLRWSTPRGDGEIRYDSPASVVVRADLWHTRAGWWAWAATVTPYVCPTDEETGARVYGVPMVHGTTKESGQMRAATDVAARAACEEWIAGEVNRE